MSTRNISWGVKAAGAWEWPHQLQMPNVMESGSLNLLEPCGPRRACYGTPFYIQTCSVTVDIGLATFDVRWKVQKGEIRNYRLGLFVCFWHNSHQWAMGSSFTRFLDHTQRRTAGGTTPLDEWWARRRDLYLTTHNTHNIHAPGGIRTRNPSRRTAADPRLKPRGHWDRPSGLQLPIHRVFMCQLLYIVT
jgi:hypothetical protein